MTITALAYAARNTVARLEDDRGAWVQQSSLHAVEDLARRLWSERRDGRLGTIIKRGDIARRAYRGSGQVESLCRDCAQWEAVQKRVIRFLRSV